MKPTARDFKDELLRELKENPKTSWGKTELVLYINEVYGEFLERYVE